jgi:hypothetical protein
MMRLVAAIGLILLCVGGVVAQESAPQESFADANIFGVIEGFWLPDDVCELGVGWERIIFDWAQHQPEGIDSWNTLNVDERWLQTAAACNREVIAVVKNTPPWATDGIPFAGVPRGLYLPIDDPDNLWANFMRRAAEFYASRGVHRFIIWNEPDIERETFGFEFEGTLEDYFQLLKVAALAAREGNPDALIHIAGTTYWHDVNEGRRLYVDQLLERIMQDPEAPAHGYYFDAVNLHIYFRTETVYQIVSEYRTLLEQYGLDDKSVWIAETNASPNLDPSWQVERPVWQIDLHQQAAFLVQAAALGLAAGADHIGVYKFYDWNLPESAESFGLLRADESRRPAFDTWRMIGERLNDVSQANFAQTETVDLVRLSHDDGHITLVAWARTAQPVQLQVSATGETALLVDQYGDMMEISPIGEHYTLALPGAICHERDGCPERIPVGGNVTLLVQPSGETEILEVTLAGTTAFDFE